MTIKIPSDVKLKTFLQSLFQLRPLKIHNPFCILTISMNQFFYPLILLLILLMHKFFCLQGVRWHLRGIISFEWTYKTFHYPIRVSSQRDQDKN